MIYLIYNIFFLVCEDGKLVRGHKIILRAGSALIKNLLAQGLYLYLYLFLYLAVRWSRIFLLRVCICICICICICFCVCFCICFWLCIDQESSCSGLVFHLILSKNNKKSCFPVRQITNWELSFCSRIKTSAYSARSSSTMSYFSDCQVILIFVHEWRNVVHEWRNVLSLKVHLYWQDTCGPNWCCYIFGDCETISGDLVLSNCPYSWYVLDYCSIWLSTFLIYCWPRNV